VHSWKSPIEEQSRRSPPWTRSNPFPAPDQTQAKVTMNVRSKSHPQQRKISSKITKGKQQLKQLPANPKFLTVMTHANPKFVMMWPMLTVDVLHKAGKPGVELYNYYINNYKSGQDITVSYKDHHFLVGDGIFLITWSDLYDLFILDALDVSLMRYFTL
jgi:hypothetical protein